MSGPGGKDVVREEIARRAYTRFCDRGCVHGGDKEDWLAAEREVLAAEQERAETDGATKGNPPPRRNRKARR